MAKILISGAGIAGLALARQLKKFNIPFVIIDKRKELVPEGAAIALPANAIKALRYIGLGDKIEKAIHKVKQITYTDTDGIELSSASLLEFPLNKDFFGALKRTQLHDILFEGLDTEIYMNTIIKKIDSYQNGLSVEFNNPILNKQDFSIIIGADGIHSGVRALFYKEEEVTKEFPLTSWRWVCKYNTNSLQPIYMIGENDCFMIYPISDEEIYCYAHVRDPEGHYKKPATRENLMKHFAQYGGIAQEILQKIPDDQSILTGRFRVMTTPLFSINNQVALVGDAGHACTPMLQQGAACALEDVIVVAEFMNHYPFEKTLLFYEKFRKERVTWIMNSSNESTKNVATMNLSSFNQRVENIRQFGPPNVQGWRKLFGMKDTLLELQDFLRENL